MAEYRGFVGGSYQSQALTADCERTVNFYVEPLESAGATSRSALYPTPGVEELSEATLGPGRAHFYESGREFAVIGTTFYELDSVGTLTSRGSVALDSNPATISSNGDGGGELLITSGGNGYIFTLATNVLSQVAALNGIATMGAQLDGYFLVLDAATSTLWVSDLLDGTTWDPTQFAQRSIASDPWNAMKVANRYIWLFGDKTSEVWYDAGSFPFPFEPHPAGALPYGCIAAFSPAVAHGVLRWLGQSNSGEGMVLEASGFAPDVISTFPLQTALQGYARLDNARGDTYDDLGHTFYLLSIPSAGITWCYDAQTRLWTERGTWIEENGAYDVWRPCWHAKAFNEHRWLDANDGSVYRSDVSLMTDVDGRVIRRLRRPPALQFENQRLFFASLELELEPGVGTQTGQGSNPQVMMRFSNDGGKTWSSEYWRSAGKVGKYGTRVIWHRLGAGRRRTFEFVMTDPVAWRLTNAYVRLAQEPAGQRQVG